MQSKFLGRAFAALLVLAFAVPAHAGIFATIKATNTWHSTWDSPDDGRPSVPVEGTLTSNLVKLKLRHACRVVPTPGDQMSWCAYDADFSGVASPFENEFKTRFKSDAPLSQSLLVNLDVLGDGSYFGTFAFVQGKTETYTDQTGTYQSSLNTDYQFWFEGTGLALDSYVDLDFTKRIWNDAVFTKQYLSTQWDVTQLLDSGDANTLEFEQWQGYFDARTGNIPEPAGLLLFATGLLALFGQRAAKRRAGVVGGEA